MTAMLDLRIFRDSGDGRSNQTLADANDNGQVVSGMAKLAQRFALQLFTLKGSIPQSEDGCAFVGRLTSQRAASESDVFAAFTSSLAQVVQRLQAEQVSDDPDDEILASVTISSLTLSEGRVDLAVVLENQAGVRSLVSLPLDFVLS